MANYTGTQCPVCKKEFGENEDIVTCPLCGTPSHRECYTKLGGCINSSKHKDGFEFKIVKEEKSVPVEASQVPAKVATVPVKAALIQENDEKESEKLKQTKFNDFDDYSNAIGKNNEKYNRRFAGMKRRNSKLSWNFAAAIFGPYWFFFRKMSRIGTLFLGVELIINMLVSVVFKDVLLQAARFYNDMAVLMGNPESTKESIMAFYNSNMSDSFLVPAMYVFFGVAIVRIIGGIFANNFYKNKIKSLVDSADSKINDPEFVKIAKQRGLFTGSISNIRTMYLTQLGGTSVFPVLIGYLGYMIVTRVLSTFI